MKESDEKLWTALATVAQHRVGEFSSQGLANSVWAFAVQGVSLDVFARAVEWRGSELNAQHLANAAWAFATMGFSAEKTLFAALGRAIRQHMG